MRPATSGNRQDVSEPEDIGLDHPDPRRWLSGWLHYVEALASRDRDDPNERAWE